MYSIFNNAFSFFTDTSYCRIFNNFQFGKETQYPTEEEKIYSEKYADLHLESIHMKIDKITKKRQLFLHHHFY